MPSPLFYLFALLMISGGVCVVALKNPVSSAMGMIGSFIGIAALLIGLNAYFIGTLQVLVYAGAIMVLFIFIIMLLDIKKEENRTTKYSTVAVGVAIPLAFVLFLIPIMQSVTLELKPLNLVKASTSEHLGDSIAKDSQIRAALRGEKDFSAPANFKKATLPDTNLTGHTLYTKYNFPLQVVGVLLLVATIGCVTLSKKLHGEPAPVTDGRMAKTLPRSAEIPTAPALPKAAVDEENVVEKEITTEAETKAETKEEPTPEPAPQPEHSEIDEKRGLVYTQRPDEADDLKVINGVGPVLEEKLNGFGIYTYKQVVDWSDENIVVFDDLLSFKGRIQRDSWLTQAKELHDKKYS